MIKGIGIDLGTTNSVLAYVNQNNEVICVKNEEGKTLTPSAVTFYNNEYIVGEGALNVADMDSVASYFKPHMGSPEYIHMLGNKRLGAIELSGLVLSKLKADAEVFLGEPLKQVVITVPAYFMAPHREATIAAAKLAGLQVVKLINEPTAAALHYGVGKDVPNGYFLVYDLGGGTFDVSLIHLDAGEINVIASRGDYNLGGANWRNSIVEYLAQVILMECELDITQDLSLQREITAKAEKAKTALSSMQQTVISLYINGILKKYTLTRSDFENMTSYLMGQTLNLIDDLLRETHIEDVRLNQILLVGGSCRMPMVAEILKNTYKTEVRTCANLDEVVACGAALEAARSQINIGISAGSAPRFQLRCIRDVIGHSLGLIATDDKRTTWVNSTLIPKDSIVPADCTEEFELATPRNDNSMDVYLTQGEDRNPKYCTVVSHYEISGIPRGKDSKQKLCITYRYDESGVIKVSAHTAEGTVLQANKQPEIGDLSWLDKAPSEQTPHASTSVILSIDLSGSMSGTPLDKSQEAAKKLITQLNAIGTKIGLIVFADRAMLQCPLTDNLSDLNECVDQWEAGTMVGYGNRGTPFETAQKEFEKTKEECWLLVLSDGMWSNSDAAIKLAKKTHAQGILVVGIGFGSADEEFLTEISNSSMGSCFTNLENLSSSFNSIASEISAGHGRIKSR